MTEIETYHRSYEITDRNSWILDNAKLKTNLTKSELVNLCIEKQLGPLCGINSGNKIDPATMKMIEQMVAGVVSSLF